MAKDGTFNGQAKRRIEMKFKVMLIALLKVNNVILLSANYINQPHRKQQYQKFRAWLLRHEEKQREEIARLRAQLATAQKALKQIAGYPGWDGEIAKAALKKLEGDE